MFAILCQYVKVGCLFLPTKKAWRLLGNQHSVCPLPKPNDCNIADVLFISQIYNVQPELKHNKEQMLRQYSSSPNNAKPYVGCCPYSKLFPVQLMMNQLPSLKFLTLSLVKVIKSNFPSHLSPNGACIPNPTFTVEERAKPKQRTNLHLSPFSE